MKKNYKIYEITREYQGRKLSDLVIEFNNGHKFVLIPLVKQDSKKQRAFFYALLDGTARK